MTNNGKYFTFLFSHSSKSRILIKRVEVSKKLLQNGLVSSAFIFVFALVGAGIYGAVTFIGDSNLEFAAGPAITRIAAPITVNAETIDYSRPVVSQDYVQNSGGPLSTVELGSEDTDVEKQLRQIQASADPTTIPAMWAHLGKINNEFGFRRNPFGGRIYEFHGGIDIDGERGQLVFAPASGTVIEAGYKGGYGNMIEIDHGNGLTTRYGHLSKIDVELGQGITRGQGIGLIGSTGRSTGPHLHYELRINGRPINPRRFLPPEPKELVKPTE